jgi:hypothetical protein
MVRMGIEHMIKLRIKCHDRGAEGKIKKGCEISSRNSVGEGRARSDIDGQRKYDDSQATFMNHSDRG